MIITLLERKHYLLTMWNAFKPRIERYPIRLHELADYDSDSAPVIRELHDFTTTPQKIEQELTRVMKQEEAYGLYKEGQFGFQQPLQFFQAPVSWSQLHAICNALKEWTSKVHRPEKHPTGLRKLAHLPSPARRLADRLTELSIQLHHARARRRTRQQIRQGLLQYVGARHGGDGHIDHMYHAPARPLNDSEKSQYGPPRAHEVVEYYVGQHHQAQDTGFRNSFAQHVLEPSNLIDQQKADLKRLKALEEHLNAYEKGLQEAEHDAKHAPVPMAKVIAEIESEIEKTQKWKDHTQALCEKLTEMM